MVATCDVHFLDPEDEIYRRIIMAGQGFENSDEQATCLLCDNGREMLKEFAYLGSEKAEEVVITNTNRIADKTAPFLSLYLLVYYKFPVIIKFTMFVLANGKYVFYWLIMSCFYWLVGHIAFC